MPSKDVLSKKMIPVYERTEIMETREPCRPPLPTKVYGHRRGQVFWLDEGGFRLHPSYSSVDCADIASDLPCCPAICNYR